MHEQTQHWSARLSANTFVAIADGYHDRRRLSLDQQPASDKRRSVSKKLNGTNRDSMMGESAADGNERRGWG